MVTECVQCGEGTTFEVVQLLAALDLDMESKNDTHGQMTALIRYHKLFSEKKDSLILSFTLGNDISLRNVLGLPTLLSMGATLNLSIGKLICSELNLTSLYY